MAAAKRISRSWRLPDGLWEVMEPLVPKRQRRSKRGRRPLDLRTVADGIFYVLRTGIQWKAVPREFGSGSSLHRYFQGWVEAGVFWRLWQQGLLEYDDAEGIQWDWQSIDAGKVKSPLGGEKNRQQPHRSRQKGNLEERYHRWLRSSTRIAHGRSECSRHQTV
jgi:transposase